MSGTTYKTTERVSTREVEGELIILDLDDGDFFVARGTSPRIWELLVGGTTVDAIADQLVERYGIARAQAEADITAFVDDLITRGFLEPTN